MIQYGPAEQQSEQVGLHHRGTGLAEAEPERLSLGRAAGDRLHKQRGLVEMKEAQKYAKLYLSNFKEK